MEKSKIKNIIILILVLMNVFLLIIVVTNIRQSRQIDKGREDAIREILSERGMPLDEDIVLEDTVPVQVTLKRDLAREQKILNPLFGRSKAEDQGGDVYLYSSNGGDAKFRGTGEFEISLQNSSFPSGSDPEKTAVSLLKSMGIDCEGSDAGASGSEASDDISLTVRYDGKTVFNCQINCEINDDNIDRISGRRIFDKVSFKSSPDEYPDCGTILMRFLEYIKFSGDVCTGITDLDSGYLVGVQNNLLGECTLSPVWRVTTNSNQHYYFDAITSEPLYVEG